MKYARLAALGIGIAAGGYTAHAASESQKLAALAQRLERLDSRVTRVEGLRAIKRLQNAYGHYAELGLWNDLADLFSNNPVGFYPAGRIAGKPALLKLFMQDIGRGRLGLDDGRIYPHIMLQPVATLSPDGRSAKGRWRVLAMLGGYGGNATWSSGVYENEFVLEDGAWKLNVLQFDGQYSGVFNSPGWRAAGTTRPFHYDPAPVSAQANVGASVTSLAQLQNRFTGLEPRVRRLRDESEVANLQHSYGYYMDRKLWDHVADLFSSGGVMELGQQGRYVGTASIRRGLNRFGPQGLRDGEVQDRIHLQTLVSVVDERTARARGVELVLAGVSGQGAEWTEGIYENEYVREGGVWKIRSLHFSPRMITAFDQGWAKDAKQPPGPSKDFPPDSPPSEVHEIYPKFHLFPFHFANPVTGRAPQYPPGVSPTPLKEPQRDSSMPAVRSVTELETRLTQSERQADAAEAYEAVENLTNAYGYYSDDFRWDDLSALFAKDERERIRQSLKNRYGDSKPAGFVLARQTAQPVIHVAPDGRSAKIRSRLLRVSGPGGGPGMWAGGIYENAAVKEDGSWKLSRVDLDYTWTADYREGLSLASLDPDAWAPRPAAASVAASFPKIPRVRFHYKNPVTGRASIDVRGPKSR